MWWNDSVVAVQTVGSAVRILLELSFFSFFLLIPCIIPGIGTARNRLVTRM